MNYKISVVIATHKRSAILKQCLDALAQQTIVDDLDVIVVSDGHDEQTEALFKHHDWKMKLRFFEIPKSQQGVARNHGAQKAEAPITLFINDDIFLAKNACEQHWGIHALLDDDSAVLGFTTWDTTQPITPTMRWLEQTGWQFGYQMLADYEHSFIPVDKQERFTYASNLSVPTTIAQKIPFREDVTLYGWEDVLWGQKLKEAGVHLYYEADAKAFHCHYITLEDSLKRMETLGKSLKHLTKIAPELNRMPKGLKLFAYHVIALFPTMRGRHYKAFLRGMGK